MAKRKPGILVQIANSEVKQINDKQKEMLKRI